MVVGALLVVAMLNHDLGASFQEHRNRWHVVAGLVTAVLATALFLGAGGFILFGAAVVAALGLGRWMSGLLGGMTGDAYGAVNELCEVVVLDPGCRPRPANSRSYFKRRFGKSGLMSDSASRSGAEEAVVWHLVRHGETEWNRSRRIQGQADVALNQNGRGSSRATRRAAVGC